MSILNLKPEKVFYYFNEICKVPHPSKKEGQMITWLLEQGKLLGLETKRDKIGNVLISKPATAGKEQVTPIIFQSHMDMVCEKNKETVFDFDKDAIQPYVDGEWIKAKGTTLGADDGIGMAIQLAILADKTIKHGPIECLFTVDEESGLSGAFALESDFMKGKMLLNLDSEDEGEFFIGCAGGVDTVATLPVQYEETPKDFIAYKVFVNGLKGGHSGDDINKGLGNANKIINRILWNAYQDYYIRLAAIDGGNLRNAIAREAEMIVCLPQEEAQNFETYLKQMNTTVKAEYAVTDSGVNIGFEPCALPAKVLNEDLQIDMMNAIYACPHGVLAMDQNIKDFVETSTNLASLKIKDNKIFFTTSQRSSVTSKKDDAAAMVASNFYSVGAEVIHSDGYPGWSPNPNSKALQSLSEAYQKIFGKEPVVRAIHAGLECGLFAEKYPDLDMVSYGPTLKGVHSPDEKLEIKTVQMCWDLTVEFLESLR